MNINYEHKDYACLEVYNLTLTVYVKIIEYLKEKYGEVLSHNDLHELNRIWNNGEYKLIDFEASFNCVPLIDLGFQTLYFKDKEVELLKLYYNEEPTEELINDFYIGIQCAFINYSICFKNNFKDINEVSINFKDVLQISKVSYEKIYSLNFYIPNDLYFVMFSFIKESFTNILNKEELFTPMLGEEIINKIKECL
jgi:thiamine kinase-like enzyme